MPLDYRKLAGISSNEEETNSAVAKTQTSDSFLEDTVSAYMAQGNPLEFIKGMDEHEKSSRNNKNPLMKLKDATVPSHRKNEEENIIFFQGSSHLEKG